MFKTLLAASSPAGAASRLTVLIFHRVLVDPDGLFPDEMHARRFDLVCGWLASWFNVIPLDQAIPQLRADTLPARSACITFDDGYADNHDVALPILKQHGLPATFFIATDFVDGGRMWNDTVIECIRRSRMQQLDLGRYGLFPVAALEEKRRAIDGVIRQIKYLPSAERREATDQIVQSTGVQPPDDLMMTSAQVKAMRHAGMQIGAHTRSHPILARLDDGQARAEIKGSKDFLESLLGERVGLFAYPNGRQVEDYSAASVNLVRELGFDAAVSTTWGAARSGADLFQIPRFTPWDKGQFRFGARLLRNLWQS